ncbi:MAG: strawberry notch C-terminal domain-containing protein, partial [Bacteroidales bacterium]|nr:strawberry notch C-terminal domain-containing protein [Bacteroidales bacterium]
EDAAREKKLRPATEEDFEGKHPQIYVDGKPVTIMGIFHRGEQVGPLGQFSKPHIDSIILTNGRSVKLSDVMVEDKTATSDKKDVPLQTDGKLNLFDWKDSDEKASKSTLTFDDSQRRGFSTIVAKKMLDGLTNGTRPFKSINDIRKLASESGLMVDADGKDDIALQELVEDGLVRVARSIVESRQYGEPGSVEAYEAICRLYEMQPTIARRSAERIRMQQYSTPLPMSFVADMFAYRDNMSSVLEPTAGNGMLVFAIPASKVDVNELDKTRLANLKEQGFRSVSSKDAKGNDLFDGEYDAVIANPPFGDAEAKDYDGKQIAGLDEQIALNALARMKDDGRAAIIIGGNMEYGKNGGINGNKAFWTYLYNHYNVKGVVDMDGKLFAKQGTTYPTRMILIDGRRSAEEMAQSTVYPPVKEKAIRKAETFAGLYEIVNELNQSKNKSNGTEILRTGTTVMPDTDAATRRANTLNTDRKHNEDAGNGRDSRPRETDSRRGESRNRTTQSSRVSEPVSTSAESSVQRRDTDISATQADNGGRTITTSERDRNQRGGDAGRIQSDGVPATGSAGGRIRINQESEKRTLTGEKLPYRPHNNAFSLESVAPAAMVEAMDNTLSEIERVYGKSVDAFVTDELGYDSAEEMHSALAAEQVDSVAMSIHQMNQGNAMIIGDQTGVGKGRQMAALIRWAHKQGKKPIFITQKADLFSDIYRDLVDVGSGELRPFIFNSDGAIVDANGNIVHKPLSSSEQAKVFATGKLPEGYDFAVLTYSQVNTGDAISHEMAQQEAKANGRRGAKKSKVANGEKPTPKATFLRQIATDNYLFLDESHTAAGDSNVGAYIRSIIGTRAENKIGSGGVKAVTFASATFAKRPDTMPMYALRTAMSQANVESGKLIGIIEKGGVTLQEIMSRALTESGQMVRRERDMSDVRTDWETISDPQTVQRARDNYDRTIAAFNAIIKFQEDYIKPKIEALSAELAITAESASVKKGTNKMGIDNVPFASKTYNYTKQLMLALKVDAIADRIEQEIKQGRHPVIALESTMEASLKDYAPNDVIAEPTFSASLLKGLETVMQYTVKDEDGNEVHRTYTPQSLGPVGERAYYELQDFIRQSTSDVFISPLDAIIEKLHAKGYKVGELTGRNLYVERDGEGRVVVKRRTDRDKKRMQREFNSGALDVLILNKSASTGISLHASSKFQDQRQRSMVIAQPLSDINDYMQMIGRIDRTGQVSRGYYINLGLPVPAENRFMMMLSTKLKSLNANTTTSQESESNSVDAPDLLNKYGSQVVVEYLRDNPDIYVKMGEPISGVSINELDEYEAPKNDDVVRKVTGYVALLSTQEQEDFYSDVVRRYNDLIKYLDNTGANDLKITVMPLKAKTLSQKVSSEGKDPTGSNPFARNAYVEEVEMDVLRKPMNAEEVRKTIEQLNTLQGTKKGNLATASEENRVGERVMEIVGTVQREEAEKLQAEEERYATAKQKAAEDIMRRRERIEGQKRSEEEKAEAIARYAEETNRKVEERHNANRNKIKSNTYFMTRGLTNFIVGKTYFIPQNSEEGSATASMFKSPAIFCGFKVKDSKVTPSTSFAVFATLDGRRRIEVKFTDNMLISQIRFLTDENWNEAQQTTLDNWDSKIPTNTRKKGYIMTGNILQAVADTQDENGGYPGQLISYTDQEGGIHDGILMPDRWEPTMLRTNGVPINARMQQILQGTNLESVDGRVRITGYARGNYRISVPKTKKDGAMYFENATILDSIDDYGFWQNGNVFSADVRGEANMRNIVNELSRLGVRVQDNTAHHQRVDNATAPISEAEAAMRDGLVEIMRQAGIEVSTNWKEGQRVLDAANTNGEVGEEGFIKTHKVEDKVTLDELNNAPTVKRYRAMQLIDGKLYPPMSAKVDGEMREPTEIGVWERSDERPDLVKNGKFTLNKGQKGQGNVPAAYNPYFHTSTSALNDQFTSAYKRPELVVVEVEIPESELTSGYKAEGAKDAVGDVKWHSGTVNGKLPEERKRTVTLSRYSKVTRIVPDSEVADMIAEQIEGTGVEIPYNVVTPSLRTELEKRGVAISNTPAGTVSQQPAMMQRVAPVFYSNAEYAVEQIKQEKATAEQWLRMIEKNGGLKAGEDKWLGLSDWLKSSDKKTLTKQEILDYINSNKIEIEEEQYVGNNEDLIFSEYKKEYKRYYDEAVANELQLRDEYESIENEFLEKYGKGFAVHTERMSDEDLRRWEELNRQYEPYRQENSAQDIAWQRMIDKHGDDFELGFWAVGDELQWDSDSDYVRYEMQQLSSEKPINSTRLQYTTDGLDNKREIAMTVPSVEPYNEGDEIHFGDAGEGRAVAWVRFGETTDKDGKRVLVIDEIQSKRHQDGREKGYADQAKAKDREMRDYTQMLYDKYGAQFNVKMTEEEHQVYDRLQRESLQERQSDKVPDAPFEKNWHEVAMKRMLRYAAENGYDKVAWTKGEQQAERYDIGAVVKKITVEDSFYGNEPRKEIHIHKPNGYYDVIETDSSGNLTDPYLGAKTLQEVFGKDLSEKILASQGMTTISGDGLRIGGEGMKGFYDQILPRFMDKYGKKWGVKTGEVELPDVEEAGRTMWSVDVTPEMHKSVMEGQPMFFRTPDGQAYGFTKDGKIYIDPRIATSETPVHEYSHLWAQSLRKANPKAWERLKEQMLGQTDVLEYVKRLYPELEGDALAEEVFTHYAGRRGAERLRQEQEAEMSKASGIFDKARVAQVFAKLRTILRDFWNQARQLFAGKVRGLDKISAEDFADMAMADLMHRVNPKAKRESAINDKEDLMVRENEDDVESVNQRFNEELQQQIDGTLPAGHVYDMGMPSDVLLSTGIANVPIQLSATKLSDKATNFGHDYDLSEVKDLVKAINSPLAVFSYGEKGKAQNIVVEIQHNGKNFIVGLSIRPKVNGRVLEINSIRNVFPKDNAEWLNWITQGKALYIDKEKIQSLIDQQRTNLADVEYLDLDSVAKIVNNFKNPEKSDIRYSKKSAADPFDLSQITLRPLKKGETSHVQRQYTEKGYFDFTGSERIESTDDVTYIFKQLETAAVENAFIVLVKDGKPVIIHTGMGSYNESYVNTPGIVAAVQSLHPDKIYFVHNHPSGKLEASIMDQATLMRLRSMYGQLVQPGIIIDTTSGKYGIFDEQWETRENLFGDIIKDKNGEPKRFPVTNTAQRPQSASREVPIKVYAFDKQVFTPDWNPETAFKVRHSKDIAAFISSHRLGEHKKMSLIVTDNSLHVTGNLFLPWTDLADVDPALIAHYVNLMGGTGAVLYGSYDQFDWGNMGILANLKNKLKERDVRLNDSIDQNGQSANDSGVFENEETYNATVHDDSGETADHNNEENNGTPTTTQDDPMAGQPLSLKDVAAEAMMKLERTHSDNIQHKLNVINLIGGRTREIIRAMASQKAYDKATINDLIGLARVMIRGGKISKMSVSEVNRLMTILRDSIGKEDIDGNADRLLSLITDMQLREATNLFNKLISVRATKTNQQGVETQGSLDIKGQTIVKTLRDAMPMSEEEIKERLAEAEDKIGSSNTVVSDNAATEAVALRIALQYAETVGATHAEERTLRNELKDAETSKKAGEMSQDEYNQYAESIKQALRDNKLDRIDALRQIAAQLGGIWQESRQGAIDYAKKEKERVEKIHHYANSDLEGRPANPHAQETRMQRVSNSSVVRFFTKPLQTFEQMMRMFGGKSVNGEGYLYNHFVRGHNQASDTEFKGFRKATHQLDEKAAEIFGEKKMLWSKLYSIERHLPKITVDFYDGKEGKTPHVLSQGNALYIYMVNKMADGRMKLRRMGISKEDVERIKEQLDPRFIELADWLQSEFLPQQRERYNEVHKRLFGASMAAIDDYFPLRILANARSEEIDVAEELPGDTRPSTTTGSIKKRTRNSLPLDVMGTDAFSLIVEHLQEMEHWAAFAEYNRDINTLLSYKLFRNRVQNMTTIYGSGRNLWKNFVDTARMAAGTYHPKVGNDSIDKTMVNIAKGVTTAKISFRVYTALKQLLSFPAYFASARIDDIALSLARPAHAWRWAMKNMPLFDKRWQSRQAGDSRLKQTEMDFAFWHNNFVEAVSRIGLTPNAFVDCMTVAIGGYAIYKTKYHQYLVKDGYTEEQAHQKAVQDASIAVNLTQQSSEDVFLSPIQLDRSAASVALSVFRNASFSYQRQLSDAIRSLRHMLTPGYKEQSIAFMTKQMVREGLDESMAERAAKRAYNRAWAKHTVRIFLFGYGMQLAWNLGAYLPYLLSGGDDDKKKEMIDEAATHALFGSIEGFSGGSLMSEAGNIAVSGESLANYDPTLLPLLSDIKKILHELDKDSVAAFNDIVNLIAQSGFGANPQTITDMAVAIWDACEGDPQTSREAAIVIWRIFNAPQSNIDQLYLDEIDMPAAEARNLGIPELAKRYAHYKRVRNATLTQPLYSDEKQAEVEDKYVEKFEKLAKERLMQDAGINNDTWSEYTDYQQKKAKNVIDKMMKQAMKSETATQRQEMLDRIGQTKHRLIHNFDSINNAQINR